MTYQVVYTRAARKALNRLPKPMVNRIRVKIEELAENPRTASLDVVKLQGRPGYRLRVGDYRVIYELVHDQLVILILQVGARGSFYVQDSDDRNQRRKGGRYSDDDIHAVG